jgi:hypothetical protein
MSMRRVSRAFLFCAILAGCGSSDNTNVEGGAGSGGGGGSGGSGGAGGAAGGGANPCGITEMEPNNTRDNPTAYTAGAAVVACIGSDTDVDFYELTAPMADVAGGYYQAGLTDVGADGMLDVKVYTASDNSAVVENTYTIDKGGSLFFYWAAAPGQKYRIAVSNFVAAGKPFKYTLKATYNKVNDTFEPNDTPETAKPLTLATPVMGYLYTGFKAKDIDAKEYEDWFSFTLAAGMVSIKLENVPTNIAGQVKLRDPTGSEVFLMPAGYNTTMGGSVIATGMIMAAGAHKLVVNPCVMQGDEGGKAMNATMIPDNFTRAYKLTVSQ